MEEQVLYLCRTLIRLLKQAYVSVIIGPRQLALPAVLPFLMDDFQQEVMFLMQLVILIYPIQWFHLTISRRQSC